MYRWLFCVFLKVAHLVSPKSENSGEKFATFTLAIFQAAPSSEKVATVRSLQTAVAAAAARIAYFFHSAQICWAHSSSVRPSVCASVCRDTPVLCQNEWTSDDAVIADG